VVAWVFWEVAMWFLGCCWWLLGYCDDCLVFWPVAKAF